uniref:HTH myb-type domain-containing protein n=1 Tax=Aplanochytrium stocchinoi TaxID=215587 RepID=A0A7S3V3A7_9STRA|mmetsp:Transcript_1000/g.1270  ORF Transcript_1000/g.1270 Transcript_1000/m.1270 type:complete len:251 (+) Transcript_1000:215-967(+)|eukprot:CAMPEP_0204831098 /NCGR_PEP_ID=MMETSP1346-20131115/9826_1 /ASSEMBLY_ACC=CAM_ASM_000771 /TAXON_ID=215587 /ORGANISM="Aplanochytrium stocchinoi, Strain GSBS06" /LENGTH=250 /DNA_ID=CAMNT_0051961839 /DNA_START=204 /DNA_END=956 /DNA_ORIENTATION=-
MAPEESASTYLRPNTNEKLVESSAKAADINTNAKPEYRVGRWTTEEHKTFLAGLKLHGKNWKKISLIVKTRSSVQTRTHAQKYFLKKTRSKGTLKVKNNSKNISISETKKKRKRNANDSWYPKTNQRTKPLDTLEKIDVFTDGHLFDSTLMEFNESVHTPRSTNMKMYPPAPQRPNVSQVRTAKDKVNYARSLDLGYGPELFETVQNKSKTQQTDVRIPSPLELELNDNDPLMLSVDLITNDILDNVLLF